MMKTYIAVALAFVIMGCQSAKKESLKSLDLLQYGMPISIMVPDTVDIKKQSMLFQDELHITGEDNYNMVISMNDAVSLDQGKIKSEKLKGIKDHRYFFRIVEESDAGFIYENRIDSNHTSFGFNVIKIQGDKEYLFENGRAGMFSLEEATRMYQAVTEISEK